MADVIIRNEGTIFLVTPNSDEAEVWFQENVSEDSQYFGRSLVCEHRYVENLVHGMQQDGLIVC